MPEMRHPPATAPQLPAGVSFPADNNESAMSDSSGQNSVSETGVNSASEAGAVSLDPSVTYKDEEETIVDTDQIRVVVQGYEPNGQSEDGKKVFKSRLSIENKTQNEVELYFEGCAVNRFSTDINTEAVIAAKGTEEVTLEFDIGVLSAAGIVSVDEIEGQIVGLFESDDDYIHIFRFYPTGKKAEDVIAADPVTEDDLTVLADNEHLLFGILKHNAKTDFLLSDSKNKEREVYFYAVNRDEETMSLTLGKLSVNGNDYYVYVEDDDSSEQGKKTFMDHYRISIMSCCPGCSIVSGFPLDDRFMDENQIDSFEDITEMILGLNVSLEGEYTPIYADLLVYYAEGNGSESALKPAYVTVDYVQEEQLIADRDEYKLSVTGYEPESVVMNQWGSTFQKAFLIHLQIQNKTDVEWTYIVGENISVNDLSGFGISEGDQIQVRVPSGETRDFVCYVPSDRFEENGIDSVDEVRFSLSGGPNVITNYHYEEYEVFPTGKKSEDVLPAVSAELLQSDEYVTLDYSLKEVIGISFKINKDGSIYDDGIRIYAQNLYDDSAIEVSITDVYVDGVLMETDEEHYYYGPERIPCLIDEDGKVYEMDKDKYEDQRKRQYTLNFGTIEPQEVGTSDHFISKDVLRHFGKDEDTPSVIDFKLGHVLLNKNPNPKDRQVILYIQVHYDLKAKSTKSHISFEIEDFDGKVNDSKEVFAGSKITMINLWTTWSGPFVKKLPELESLSSAFEKKGCRIVGICMNAKEEKEEALRILQDAGVTFLNLAATDDHKDVFRFESIPTTYFVDSEGNLLSDPVEGTDINLFQETLDSLLEDLD